MLLTVSWLPTMTLTAPAGPETKEMFVTSPGNVSLSSTALAACDPVLVMRKV